MKLQLYIYKCGICGNNFKSPGLIGNPYGEFLMRSDFGEVVYLSSFNDTVFQEVIDFTKNSSLLNDANQSTRVDVMQYIFGETCDLSPSQKKYQIGVNPPCPECLSKENLSWQPSNPPEIIDMPVQPATHDEWNKLENFIKEEKLNKAIQLYLLKQQN